MVLKHNKRVLEDGKSCQPIKYHKQLEYNLHQVVGLVEIAPNKISSKIRSSDSAQLDNKQGYVEDELLSSSRATNLSNGISFNDATYLLKDEVPKKLIEVVKLKTNNNGPVGTDLVHSPNSFCGHKQEHCTDSKISLPSDEVAEAVLTYGTTGGSKLHENEFQTPREKLFDGKQAKDIETCVSFSSVGNSRSSRISEDLVFGLVSASSPSPKYMLCESDTMGQAFKGSEKLDLLLVPSFVSGSATCAEFDYNEEHFSHCDSTTGFGGYNRKKVPVGPEFQAEIPMCRPQVHMYSNDFSVLVSSQHLIHTDNNDRYLHSLAGIRVWPLAGSNDRLHVYSAGQGRSSDCGCPDANSIRCIKEHIRVEREKLKLKLGEAFSLWGFDDMGESVSAKWTRQEEETFRNIVSMNPMSSNKNFWNYLAVAFPLRSKMELVSYYFNVFVLRRRALQNRVDPYSIDSDDDEEDWHDSEIGLSDRLMMIEEDDSEAESDATEGDDEVAESDEELAETTEEEDEVTASYMSEGHMSSRVNHRITFGDQGNQDEHTNDVMGEFRFPLQHKLFHSNDLIGMKDFQDESCMSYEWNLEDNSSGLICVTADEDKFKEATSSDDSCEEEKQASLHYGNEVLCGDVKPNGNFSHKEFAVDGHSSLLEPYDSKLWDIALVTSLKTDADRFVSTCSLIKELFGDETRDNDRNRI